MCSYTELKEQIAQDLSDFPMAFAFSQAQFEEAKEKLGVKEDDNLISIGAGGIIKASDKDAMMAMFERHGDMRREYMANDDNLQTALVYELSNHEYGYTGDPEPTLEALGLDGNDERVRRIFPKAVSQYMSTVEL